MKATVRSYRRDLDYESVGHFLVRTYSTTGAHVNWLQPRWEYMHYHPLIEGVDLDAAGVWEVGGEVVGVVHQEHQMGAIYFEVHASYAFLKEDMLAYAEEHLSVAKDGIKALALCINDRDQVLHEIAATAGYRRHSGFEAMSRAAIPASFPAAPLAAGFRLQSLADDNDLSKIDRVLWRGFGHGDEPPDGGIEDRKFMQSAPNFRPELNIVVQAPDENFASYCGMWYEPEHRVAYVEPVATDPDYRRMGLGNVAVVEGIRRCGELGATAAYVGSDMPFYRSMGFEPVHRYSAWRREWR